jgi:hypothetical protein
MKIATAFLALALAATGANAIQMRTHARRPTKQHLEPGKPVSEKELMDRVLSYNPDTQNLMRKYLVGALDWEEFEQKIKWVVKQEKDTNFRSGWRSAEEIAADIRECEGVVLPELQKIRDSREKDFREELTVRYGIAGANLKTESFREDFQSFSAQVKSFVSLYLLGVESYDEMKGQLDLIKFRDQNFGLWIGNGRYFYPMRDLIMNRKDDLEKMSKEEKREFWEYLHPKNVTIGHKVTAVTDDACPNKIGAVKSTGGKFLSRVFEHGLSLAGSGRVPTMPLLSGRSFAAVRVLQV